jgi:hypothetical protein
MLEAEVMASDFSSFVVPSPVGSAMVSGDWLDELTATLPGIAWLGDSW